MAGNSRYSSAKDFGWRMYVDNPLEDLHPASSTCRAHVDDEHLRLWEEDEAVQVIRVTWSVDEVGALVTREVLDAYIVAALSDTYSYDRQGSLPYDDDDVCTA